MDAPAVAKFAFSKQDSTEESGMMLSCTEQAHLPANHSGVHIMEQTVPYAEKKQLMWELGRHHEVLFTMFSSELFHQGKKMNAYPQL